MKSKKPLPTFASDDEEQAFLDSADLTEYDLETGFKPFGEWLSEIEMKRKDARVDLRLPRALVDAYKAQAAVTGAPYQRLMRQALERGIAARRRA
jgi:predicted DNA binding CopG/RHH family protein